MSKLEKVIVGFDDLGDPRLLDVPRSFRLVDVEARAWSAQHGTDGRIPGLTALRCITDEPEPAEAAAALVAAGLWTAVDGGGWQLDWSGQMTAERATRIRKGNLKRFNVGQEREERHRSGDHSICLPQKCKEATHAVSNGVTHAATDLIEPNRTVTSARSNGEVRQSSAPAFEEAAGPTVECVDYSGHRSWHQRTAKGWICKACSHVPLTSQEQAAVDAFHRKWRGN